MLLLLRMKLLDQERIKKDLLLQVIGIWLGDHIEAFETSRFGLLL